MNADQAKRLGVEREWERYANVTMETTDGVVIPAVLRKQSDALIDAIAAKVEEMEGRRCRTCAEYVPMRYIDGAADCDHNPQVGLDSSNPGPDFGCCFWTARKPTEEGSS